MQLPDLLTERVTVNDQRMPATAVGRKIGQRMTLWAQHSMAEVTSAEPEMPEGVYGRAAQIGAPLLAIADAAGGDWPARAREACEQLALHGSAPDVDAEDGIADLLDSWAAS